MFLSMVVESTTIEVRKVATTKKIAISRCLNMKVLQAEVGNVFYVKPTLNTNKAGSYLVARPLILKSVSWGTLNIPDKA